MKYNDEDRTMTAENLQDKYGNESGHPIHNKVDWRCDVHNQYTMLGYWRWVEWNITLDYLNQL